MKPTVVIRPDAEAWPRPGSTPFALTPAQRRLREQWGAGLATDRPIVMTGHQAEFWHAGVLAKYLAADAAAGSAAVPAATAWLVVDQDANEPHAVRYPALESGPGGSATIAARTWRLAPTGGGGAGVVGGAGGLAGFLHDTPASCLASMRAQGPTPRVAGPRPDALDAVAAALAEHADAPNAARQVTLAARDLLRPHVVPGTVVYATDLSRTDLFQAWVERMASDPAACVRAYNAAALDHPAGHVRPLELTSARVELPLWRLRMGGPRRRVLAHELSAIPPHELAPRALFMTALVRAAACDLFIHGLGGEQYEAVTEQWLRDWWPQQRLAPMAVVSATMHLRLDEVGGLGTVPTPEEVAHAVWHAHHAAHDPASMGDPHAAAAKRELLAAIGELPRRDPRRGPIFQALQRTLRDARAAAAGTLTAARERAERAHAGRAVSRVVYDRTWSFPLHTPGDLAALDSAVRGAFKRARAT